ncbi:MAG TPA: hypothetical protein VHA82_00970 [Ramlibacter sp.]|uniref:hypothetical protein n=1 Tax=Ramlibacter sp. TaxID=1917967 RepID=UPI002B9F8085|nr:hypothetical protein [Ramlibacter sp.]HVZ42352.1 hypothetical protein [Ramlibacter sp.]
MAELAGRFAYWQMVCNGLSSACQAIGNGASRLGNGLVNCFAKLGACCDLD